MRLYLETLKKIESEFEEFDISFGISREVYLRFGYWKRVNQEKLQKIIGSSFRVIEETIYDDDCGDLFLYELKPFFVS